MSFYAIFIFSSYLMAFIGLVSLTLAQESLFYLILSSFSLIISGYLVHKKEIYLFPKIVNTLLAVIAFLFIIVDRYFLYTPLLDSLSHFLIFIQLIKLFQKKENRDFLQIYLISFIHLLIASVTTLNIFFSFFFLIYMVTGIWTFILFHFKKEIDRENEIRENLGKPIYKPYYLSEILSTKKLIGITTGISIFTLLHTIFIFIIVPRVGLYSVNFNARPGQSISGFSEEVRLGDIGSIKENPQEVMRIQIIESDIDLNLIPLLWRGKAFDYYDGKGWKLSSQKKDTLNADINGNIYIEGNKESLGTIENSKYYDIAKTKFTIEGLNTKYLFTLYYPLVISDGPYKVKQDLTNSIRATDSYYLGIKYTVTSKIPKVPDNLNIFKNSTKLNYLYENYLQIPKSISPKVYSLAELIVKGIDNPYLKVKRIEEFLKNNYGYTLKLKANKGVEPIEDFLFNVKEGHCEYFGSSMVILVRALGIPARLVNGFSGGEWNSLGGGYYIIRQQNAHTWVEVYFDGVGWLTFDPTPSDIINRKDKSAFFKYISHYVDYFHLRWKSNVVDYDIKQQKAIINKTFQIIGKLQANTSKLITQIKKIEFSKINFKFILYKFLLLILIILGFLILLSFILKFYGINLLTILKKFKIVTKESKSHSVKFYDDLLTILKQKGFYRKESFTPYEFANYVITTSGNAFNKVLEVTDYYYKVRFGYKTLSKEEVIKIENSLKEIQRIRIVN